jgi:glycosyltransferase involved in cell wall biosynthesis
MSQAAPRVSVVIPTHNRRGLLEETLASLARQSWPGWEAVVVDDASEDDTWSWLAGQSDSRLRKVRLETKSERAAARNAGLEAARGDHVLFLDDDDQLPTRALAAHLAAVDRHPQAIASIGGYEMFGEPAAAGEVRIVRRACLRPILHDVLFGWMAVSGQCLFRAGLLRELGGWEGSRIPIEDHVLWLRAAARGPVALLPEIVLRYRVHAGQWRPENLQQMMTDVREEAVARWIEPERALGRRILAGRALATAAYRCYHDGRRLAALPLFARALALLPSVRRSPLARPQVLEAMLKCLVGGRGVHVLHRLEQGARRALRPPARERDGLVGPGTKASGSRA